MPKNESNHIYMVNGIHLKLPKMLLEDAELCIAQIEAQFHTSAIRQETSKQD